MTYHEIGVQVVEIHEQLRSMWPHLRRIAIALYDHQNDELHTFINSTDGGSPLNHYTQKLSEVPSLLHLVQTKNSRIIDDLDIFSTHHTLHSEKILEAGFRSSYTVPIFRHENSLLGFIFYDADEREFFTDSMQKHLDVYSELIESMVIADILPLRMVQAAVSITQTMARYKDEETGEHIARMAHYARVIAAKIAEKTPLSDSFIQYILLYAPLHDIGKVGVPDAVLLKPGLLDEGETTIMQTHVTKGVEIIDALLEEFDLGDQPHTSILRNIVAYHHERLDGLGYPYALAADTIPLESKIASVADVFDALTSDRPYRKGWSTEEAVAYLQTHSGTQFDPQCVDALIASWNEVQEIMHLFKSSKATSV